MIYVIKRETLIPWDQSEAEITLRGEIFDIVTADKNTGLDRVADYVIEDGIIVKSPGEDQEFIEVYESVTGSNLHELLLG